MRHTLLAPSGGEIGHGSTDNLGDNYHIGVSHDVKIDPEFRGQGYGNQFMKQRLDEMYRNGFQYVICTVSCSNERQIHLLEKWGWRCIDTMDSGCNEGVHLYRRELQVNNQKA